MKEDRGLSDKELALKYEAGTIDLSKVLQKIICETQTRNKKETLNKDKKK